jgi:hypothetical protein
MTTALLDSPPSAAHPVLAGAAEIARALDAMLAGAGVRLDRDHARAIQALEQINRRVDALKLKLLAAADRAGVPADAGFTGTGAWAAKQTTVTPSTAARLVALATELDAGGHDTLTEALDRGRLSPAHAAVIVRAGLQLPRGVSDARRRQVEAALVEKAARFDPDQLRREARRALAVIEPDRALIDAHEDDLLRTEEDAALSRTRLTLHANGDGTVTGHFTFPTLAGAILVKVLDAITAPRRMRDPVRSDFDWAHRRGVAFAELVEHLPTDHLHPKSAATLVVTLDHTVLRGALRAARLDTGDTLSAGEARRLACTAGLVPAVLGSRSVALDLGRETRLFSEAQRLAAGLTQRTCAADGCERPYAWCELHHHRAWALGGPTDLANAVPLCHQHHQWIHDTAYCHRRMPDGSVRFSRRT